MRVGIYESGVNDVAGSDVLSDIEDQNELVSTESQLVRNPGDSVLPGCRRISLIPDFPAT